MKAFTHHFTLGSRHLDFHFDVIQMPGGIRYTVTIFEKGRVFQYLEVKPVGDAWKAIPPVSTWAARHEGTVSRFIIANTSGPSTPSVTM